MRSVSAQSAVQGCRLGARPSKPCRQSRAVCKGQVVLEIARHRRRALSNNKAMQMSEQSPTAEMDLRNCRECQRLDLKEKCQLGKHDLKEAFEGTKSELLCSYCPDPDCGHKFSQHFDLAAVQVAAQAAPTIEALCSEVRKLTTAQREMREEARSEVRKLTTVVEGQVAAQREMRETLPIEVTNRTVAAISEKCNMSKASSSKHSSVFTITDNLPMVEASDPRVAPLVRSLDELRRKPKSHLEAECRRTCLDPFFQCVGQESGYNCLEPPTSPHYKLSVLVASVNFEGYSDLLLGASEDCLPPSISLEFKPRKGQHNISPDGFRHVQFSTKVKVINQTVAYQSMFNSVDQRFICGLTNLDCLYLVRVKSYDHARICAGAYAPLTESQLFVRALLHALDSNSDLLKRVPTTVRELTCLAADGFPPAVPDPHAQRRHHTAQGGDSPPRGGTKRRGGKGRSRRSRFQSDYVGPIEALMPGPPSKTLFRQDFVAAALKLDGYRRPL